MTSFRKYMLSLLTREMKKGNTTDMILGNLSYQRKFSKKKGGGATTCLKSVSV